MTLDREQISNLVDKYADMVLRLAFSSTHNRAEAEDIMQDVFLALIKKGELNDEEHAKAWIIRVCINKSKSYLRSKRSKDLSLDENSFSFNAEQKSLLTEIDMLDVKDRNIIYLHYYEGYSCRDIARILRCRENAIYTRLSRAREKLKGILEKEDKDEK